MARTRVVLQANPAIVLAEREDKFVLFMRMDGHQLAHALVERGLAVRLRVVPALQRCDVDELVRWVRRWFWGRDRRSLRCWPHPEAEPLARPFSGTTVSPASVSIFTQLPGDQPSPHESMSVIVCPCGSRHTSIVVISLLLNVPDTISLLPSIFHVCSEA